MNETYKVQVQGLVDDLKAVFTHAGLGGEAGEYKLLTQSFLYKFLNDKFLYQAKILDESNTYENLLAMSEEDYDWLLEGYRYQHSLAQAGPVDRKSPPSAK